MNFAKKLPSWLARNIGVALSTLSRVIIQIITQITTIIAFGWLRWSTTEELRSQFPLTPTLSALTLFLKNTLQLMTHLEPNGFIWMSHGPWNGLFRARTNVLRQ